MRVLETSETKDVAGGITLSATYVDTGMSCQRPEPGLGAVVTLPGPMSWMNRLLDLLF
jgi:hypothetical protein